MPDFAEARRVLERAVRQDGIPGVVAVVGDRDDTHPFGALGVTRLGDAGRAVTPETRFDLASLSKVVATLPALLQLVGAGELSFDDPVGRFFSNAGWYQQPSLAQITVRQLLTHASGLAAWRPLFATVSERRTGVAQALQAPLEHPTGGYLYSDLGFIVLGAIIERVSGVRQDVFVRERVFAPLGMDATGYGPITDAALSVAATEDCGWRNQVMQGVVHDENAYVLDGVAGHAGLFGTAGDLARYARAWLSHDARLGTGALLEDCVREHLRSPEGVRRGLGWQLKGEDSSVGTLASDDAYGHTGFTGTSLWLDPRGGWFAVLLSNRVHPSRHGGEAIHDIRVRFHEAVTRAYL